MISWTANILTQAVTQHTQHITRLGYATLAQSRSLCLVISSLFIVECVRVRVCCFAAANSVGVAHKLERELERERPVVISHAAANEFNHVTHCTGDGTKVLQKCNKSSTGSASLFCVTVLAPKSFSFFSTPHFLLAITRGICILAAR